MKPSNQLKKLAHKHKHNNWYKKYTTSYMSGVWDYRTSGVKTLKAAKLLIEAEISRQKEVQAHRRVSHAGRFTPNPGRMLRLSDQKRAVKTCLGNLAAYGDYSETPWQHGLQKTRLTLDQVQAQTKASYPYSTSTAMVGDLIVKGDFNTTEDWGYYSRSYGRPKTTVENKQVKIYTGKIILSEIGRYAPEIITIPVDGFRGNWLYKALAGYLGSKQIKVSKGLKAIQLNPYISIKKIETHFSTTIYGRYLGAHLIGYCAVKNGDHYHDGSKRGSVRGLSKKIKGRRIFEGETITKDTALELGFCETGIASFCSDNGLDFDGQYTRRELEAIVQSNNTVNKNKYSKELKQIGINL